ncbi:MAG: EAL domain-containing protein [Hyphomicrobiales bacterium]|nr:EAL domain-containing protein [Hyphomicrobiales bacterium]
MSGPHLVLEDDGAWTATWAPFVLKSAFQPIFRFSHGKLVPHAFEALLRPFRDGELVSPSAFLNGLPASERQHVETLARSLHLVNAAACLPHSAAIFVNFDPSVFSEAALADAALRETRRAVAAAGIDPGRLVCEVTEKETVSEEVLFNFVAALRRSGFRIAIDDYGVDASDMNRIHELRPDIVKFDADWIRRLMDSSAGYALLTTMVSTFAGHGIQTVFEGIETSQQLEMAEASGVDMVQGFGLAQPELAPTGFAAFAQSASAQDPHLHQPAFGEPPALRAAGELRHARAFGKRTLPQ